MSYCCFQIENWNLDLIWKAAMTNCRYAFGIFCVLAGIIFAKNDTSLPQVKIFISCDKEGKYHLNCHVKSGNSAPNITWYRNNGPVNCYGKCSLKQKKSDEQYYYWSNLTKDNVPKNHRYTCVAENKYGRSSDSLYSNDYCTDGPCLEWSMIGNVTIKVGQSYSIICQLTTLQKIERKCYEFSFSHGNASYVVKDVKVLYDEGKLFPTPCTITYYGYNITNAKASDAGVYSCNFVGRFLRRDRPCKQPLNKDIRITVIGQSRERHHNMKIAIGISVASLVSGVIIVTLMFCLRKKNLKTHRLYESQPELRWDVFVSYSSKDYAWVKELCETLERPPFNLIVCQHQRDWEVGRTVLDNMAESVYCSNKTLLIVSKSYLESIFCMRELSIALECEIATKNVVKERVILVKLDDVSLKSLPKALRDKSYLDFSNDEQRKHYKSKLLKALPRREAPCEESGDERRSEGSEDEVQSEPSGRRSSQYSESEAPFKQSKNANIDEILLHGMSRDMEQLA